MEEESIERVDRICALPEPVLQDIMSFLPFKQVAQTSILSKTWQNAWLTFPVLEFDHTFFKLDMPAGPYQETSGMRRVKWLNLLHYVEETLRNRHKKMISIKKLTLDLSSIDGKKIFFPVVNRCIGHAIGCGLRELNFEFTPNYKYILPPTVLCAESINVLELGNCKLKLPRSVKLCSLRKLSLMGVLADDEALQNVVDGCPLIEDLTLKFCPGFKSLKLIGLWKLNKITLSSNEELERLEVKALNAHSVDIAGHAIPREINIALCKNLKSLSFSMASILDEWLCRQISGFPLLEYLMLCLCNELKSIKISSFSLKRLRILSCERLVEVKLETPNLSLFSYEGDIISFSLDGLTLSETSLCFFSKNIDTQWYFKHLELLARFYHVSKVLIMRSRKGENVLFPEELRQTISPLFCGVKRLELMINRPPMSVPIKNAVDGLLWMSPHAENVSIKSANWTMKFSFEFKFSYKKRPIFEGGIAECCKSVPTSCWRHCMEKVEIKYTFREVKATDIFEERHIFEGDEIWEKIDCLTELPAYIISHINRMRALGIVD